MTVACPMRIYVLVEICSHIKIDTRAVSVEIYIPYMYTYFGRNLPKCHELVSVKNLHTFELKCIYMFQQKCTYLCQ